jgi:hypothetical protein
MVRANAGKELFGFLGLDIHDHKKHGSEGTRSEDFSEACDCVQLTINNIITTTGIATIPIA